MDHQARALIDRYWAAAAQGDFDTMEDLYAEDAVQEWPQSGERVVGRANIMAINRNYPGLPVAKVRRVRGSRDFWVVEASLDYGGERYETVMVLELREGVIVHETDVFGATFPAPEWRSLWTEKLET